MRPRIDPIEAIRKAALKLGAASPWQPVKAPQDPDRPKIPKPPKARKHAPRRR